MAKISFTGCVQEEKKNIWEFVQENIIIYMNICIHTINGRKNLFNIILIIKFEEKKCTEREWRAKKDPKYKIKKLHSED